MLTVEEVNTAEKFQRLNSDWNNLLENSANKNIFLTFDWLYAWWEHFGEGKELMTLVVKDKAETIGIAPFLIDRQRRHKIFYKRIIKFLGEGVSDYAGIIAALGSENAVFGAVFDYLERGRKRWDEIILREVRQDDPLLSSLVPLLKHCNWRKRIEKVSVCPFIGIKGGWQDYCSRISKSIMKELRRLENKLERECSCEFVINAERADPSALDEFFSVNRKRLQEKGKRGWCEKDAFCNFIKHTVNTFGKDIRPSLSFLKIDGRIAAYIIAYIYDGRLNYWNVSIRDEYKGYSPGKILLCRLIKEAHNNRLVEEIDLLRGEEKYKYIWASGERVNAAVYINK